VKFLVDPIVDRITRGSIDRTLRAFRDTNLALLKRASMSALAVKIAP
jgi:hypothetical protein